MKNNVIPFRATPDIAAAARLERSDRVIVGLGDQRIALDFTCRATRLTPKMRGQKMEKRAAQPKLGPVVGIVEALKASLAREKQRQRPGDLRRKAARQEESR